ncbi:hypothetical protein [Scytonema sp. NUACC26]|uniref:hypothetical protein n=1 Tax=Scytonema sp. NUACC26 TaxID=3140176 RepID=UPI0034DC4D76
MAKQPPEEVTKRRLTNKVENIIELSDILANRKKLGGSLGKKLAKQEELEKSVVKGNAIRFKKFKKFDDWCERTEEIVNYKGRKDIKIRRAVVVDPNNRDRVV